MKIKLTVPLSLMIKYWLISEPDLRDNDEKLILRTWMYYHPELNNISTTLSTFMYGFTSGNYIPFETIRRTRQKVQEQFPHTRGVLYYKRRKNIPEIINALQEPEMNAEGQ